MIKSEVLDALVAAGCTAEQIAAAVKADQAKSTGAARQARYRARQASRVTDSDVTSVTVTTPDKEIPPTPPKEINPPPSPPKGGSSPTRRFANPMIVLQAEVDAMTAQRWVTHCDEKGRKPSSIQAEELCSVLRQVKARGGNAVEALKFGMGKGWTSLTLEYLENNGFKFPRKPKVHAELDWPQIMAEFRSKGAWYESRYGPRPGEPDCRVPPELLERAA